MNDVKNNTKEQVTISGKDIKEYVIPHLELLCRREIDTLLSQLKAAKYEDQENYYSVLLGIDFIGLRILKQMSEGYDVCETIGVDTSLTEDFIDMEVILNARSD